MGLNRSQLGAFAAVVVAAGCAVTTTNPEPRPSPRSPAGSPASAASPAPARGLDALCPPVALAPSPPTALAAGVTPRSGVWELVTSKKGGKPALEQVGLWFEPDGQVWLQRWQDEAPRDLAGNRWKDGKASFQPYDCAGEVRCDPIEFEVRLTSATQLVGTQAVSTDVADHAGTYDVAGTWVGDAPRPSPRPSPRPTGDADLPTPDPARAPADGRWRLTVLRPAPMAAWVVTVDLKADGKGGVTLEVPETGERPKLSYPDWSSSRVFFSIVDPKVACQPATWELVPDSRTHMAGRVSNAAGIFRVDAVHVE